MITQSLLDTVYSMENVENDERLNTLLVQATDNYMKWEKEHGGW